MPNPNKGVLGVKLHQFLNNTEFFGNIYFPKEQRGDVVFFPGCSFNGYSTDLVMNVYEFLSLHYKNLGICTSCCGKPGKIIKSDKYHSHTENLLKRLKGITEIIACCPNCTTLLEQVTDIKITPIYTVLKEHYQDDWNRSGISCTIHDPCPFRNRSDIHDNVRDILSLMNVNAEEFQNNREKTRCCGKSEMMFVKDRQKSVFIAKKRVEEAKSDVILSYCFSCVHSFRNIGRNSMHLLEVIFVSKDGGGHTWANRIKLRNLLKRR